MRSLLTCLAVCVLSAGSVRADSKVDLARVDVRNLSKAVEFYKTKKGAYPARLKDLKDAGYVDPAATLLDPWGNPYRYDPKGPRNNGKKPDVWAVAPDKAEIGNWAEANKK